MTHRSVLDRFWEKVEVTDGCWLWHGSVGYSGYGRFFLGAVRRENGRWHSITMPAHRFSYELHHREHVPSDLHMDHLCRAPLCVRPDHLEPVTPGENVIRNLRYEANVCYRGHPFTDANTIVYTIRKTGRPGRLCRKCYRERTKDRKRDRRQKVAVITARGGSQLQ